MSSGDLEATYQEAISLHQKGSVSVAMRHYETVLAGDPNHADASHLLGVAYHQQGNHSRALELIGHAIRINPLAAVYFNNYGAALQQLGQLVEAMACFHRAVQLDAKYADAWVNLGLAYESAKSPSLAAKAYHEAIRIDPANIDAVRKAALLHQSQGDRSKSEKILRDALAVTPSAKLYSLLGELLQATQRFAEAVAMYKHAIELEPEQPLAYLNVAGVLADQHNVEEAKKYLGTACQLHPHKAAWKLRALSLVPAVFENSEEIDQFRQDLETRLDELSEAPPEVPVSDLLETGFFPPFQLAYHGRNCRRIKAKYADVLAGSIPSFDLPTSTGGRIRLGVVVTERHEGIFLRTMRGILRHLNRDEFEPVILCSVASELQIRRELAPLNVDVVPFPHLLPRAFDVIAEAKCDILFYREIGSDVVNYILPQARLAPLQCTALTTQITSGLPTIDYFLSTELIEPDSAQEHYTERLWCARTFPRFEYRVPRPAPADRDQLGLPSAKNLYMCLQNLLKLHPDFDVLLAQILERDPQSAIVLLGGQSPFATDQIKRRFARTIGHIADRLMFLPRMSATRYLQTLSLADVVIDPLHFGAGITTYDIFSLNLPVVTLPGEFSVSRCTSGCYYEMGFTDLIAHSPEDYVSKAVRVGADSDYRHHVQKRIERRSDALFEDLEGVREFERFFREIQESVGENRTFTS